MPRVKHSADIGIHLLGIAAVVLLLAVIVGATWLINTHAPCWLFQLKDAPVRCVVGR